MKFNNRIFNFSAWLALLTLIFFPGKVITEVVTRTEYGYPIRFFVRYHEYEITDSKWFANSISLQILYYFIDVLIIYCVICLILFIKQWMKSEAKSNE